jgi:hypothetical protein
MGGSIIAGVVVLFFAGFWGAANLSLPRGGAAYRMLQRLVTL